MGNLTVDLRFIFAWAKILYSTILSLDTWFYWWAFINYFSSAERLCDQPISEFSPFKRAVFPDLFNKAVIYVSSFVRYQSGVVEPTEYDKLNRLKNTSGFTASKIVYICKWILGVRCYPSHVAISSI